MNTEAELGSLLVEQRAYYHALAPDYLGQGLDLPGGSEIAAALEAFRPAGSVLELACGPGVWTGHLLRHAADVTAVDASSEMLAIAATRIIPNGSVLRFIQADLFTWRVEGPSSSTIRRLSPDGTAYRVVKVPHDPAGLEGQLRELGWDITVHPAAGPVYWGAGRPPLSALR